MRYLAPAVALGLSLHVLAASAQLVDSVEKINALRPGTATMEAVKSSLGQPEHIDQNPDGRSIYLYPLGLKSQVDPTALALKGKIAFLFDKEGKLLRYRVYQGN